MQKLVADQIALQEHRRGPSSGEIPTMSIVDSLSLVLVQTLGNLVSLPARRPGRIKGDPFENGWGMIGVVICAVIAETALARRHFQVAIRGRSADAKVDRFDVRTAMKAHLPDPLRHDLLDVFFVRDAVMHCHLWVGHIAGWVPDFCGDQTLPPDWGSDRYRKLANTRRTGHLGLDILPSCVWRLEAFLATRIVTRVLFELGRTDPPCRTWVTERVHSWRRKRRSLVEIEQTLEIPVERTYDRRRASIGVPPEYPAARQDARGRWLLPVPQK